TVISIPLWVGPGPKRSSGEHVRARLYEPLIDRLKVEPADIVASDMLAAVAGSLRRNEYGSNAARLDHELLLTAALERYEPEGRRINAVAAGGQQSVIAVNGGFHVLECCGDALPSVALHRYGASFILDDDMVLEEARRILRDGVEQPSCGGPGHA